MNSTSETTLLYYQISLLQSAQLQEQLALKLIQSAVENSTPVRSSPDQMQTVIEEPISSDQIIDIRV